jgi:hypothetical protein
MYALPDGGTGFGIGFEDEVATVVAPNEANVCFACCLWAALVLHKDRNGWYVGISGVPPDQGSVKTNFIFGPWSLISENRELSSGRRGLGSTALTERSCIDCWPETIG